MHADAKKRLKRCPKLLIYNVLDWLTSSLYDFDVSLVITVAQPCILYMRLLPVASNK